MKLGGLAVAVVALLSISGLGWLGVAAVAVAGLYALARIPLRVAVAQLRPVLWLGLFLLVLQVLLAGWVRAVDVTVTLLLTVALAALVTLTTRVSEMLTVGEAVLGPLRRFGVAPDRVALVLALTIRSVPLIAATVGTVRQAQQARGMPANPFTLLVPVLVRVLRHADALGEALAARGVDDEQA